MPRHFGVLIPSTNRTVEIECRLLPSAYQAHTGRLMTSAPGQTFSPPRDDDVDYQSRLLGTAKVELGILAQTSASLFADDYDEITTKRMSTGAGVPAVTSAQAVGRAVKALARPIPMRSAISARRTRATLLPASIGRRSRCLSSLAATSRRWPRLPGGSANSASRSSPPTKPRSGQCW